MYNNVSNSTKLELFILKSVGRDYASAFYGTTVLSSVTLAILSPVAAVVNALVLAAIWRNPSLRTPSYILLAGLAFTDFSTGLSTQPIYVATNVILLIEHPSEMVQKKTSYITIRALSYGFATFFGNITIMTITLMSIERWLHMTRRSLITVRRACFVFSSFLFVSIPSVFYRALYDIQGTRQLESDILSISFVVLCLTLTSVAYFKVFRIIRRHQQQIHANELSQNFAQPAINFKKYKKSVYTILYILAVFYIGFIPVLIVLVLRVVLNDQSLIDVLLNGSVVLVFLASSLNPLLYLWRMNDIRTEVRQLVKRLLRLES